MLVVAPVGAHALQTSNPPETDTATHGTVPAISAPSATNVTPVKPAKDSKEEREMQAEQSQRQFGIVPMFGVTSRQNARALTAGEKVHLWEKSAFDPFEFGAFGLQAGLSQWQNEFPGYGQGAAGYAKRYGASMADSFSSGFFSNVTYPILLKEDPRFFRLGQGSFRRRFSHALLQEFIAHKDSGGQTFAFQNLFGAMTAGGISNLYYPQSDRGFTLTMSRSAIALAYGSAGGLFAEFGPDIQAKIFHHQKQVAQ